MRFVNDAIVFGSKVVIADVHLGLLKYYDKFLIEKALKLAERFKTLIVAGDLKHLGKRGLFKEFIERVGSICELILIKGNHDAKMNIEKFIRFGKYAIFHGHANPPEDALSAKYWIVGHSHPSMYLDGVKERCFLIGEHRDKKIVVLPAFNDICASTPVNIEKPVGVVFKKFKCDWKVVLLDGTVLQIR